MPWLWGGVRGLQAPSSLGTGLLLEGGGYTEYCEDCGAAGLQELMGLVECVLKEST